MSSVAQSYFDHVASITSVEHEVLALTRSGLFIPTHLLSYEPSSLRLKTRPSKSVAAVAVRLTTAAPFKAQASPSAANRSAAIQPSAAAACPCWSRKRPASSIALCHKSTEQPAEQPIWKAANASEKTSVTPPSISAIACRSEVSSSGFVPIAPLVPIGRVSGAIGTNGTIGTAPGRLLSVAIGSIGANGTRVAESICCCARASHLLIDSHFRIPPG